MNYRHKTLAAGRWEKFSLFEQMANVGSEVERALNWKAKNNDSYSQKAFERALELIDLTIKDKKHIQHLNEFTRMREALVDYFIGSNEYKSSESSWRKYFYSFIYAARKSY